MSALQIAASGGAMPNPVHTTIRAPQRTRELIKAITEKTGMTLKQVIIAAVELYAQKVGVKL